MPLCAGNLYISTSSAANDRGELPVEKIDRPVHEDFLGRGQFRKAEKFGTLTNKPAGKASEDFTYPLMPPENEDLIRETWVPLDKDATYLELQIWYPASRLSPGEDDRSYLFQIELGLRGDTAIDGLAAVELEVKASNRVGTLALEVAEGKPL